MKDRSASNILFLMCLRKQAQGTAPQHSGHQQGFPQGLAQCFSSEELIAFKRCALSSVWWLLEVSEWILVVHASTPRHPDPPSALHSLTGQVHVCSG